MQAGTKGTVKVGFYWWSIKKERRNLKAFCREPQQLTGEINLAGQSQCCLPRSSEGPWYQEGGVTPESLGEQKENLRMVTVLGILIWDFSLGVWFLFFKCKYPDTLIKRKEDKKKELFSVWSPRGLR